MTNVVERRGGRAQGQAGGAQGESVGRGDGGEQEREQEVCG